MAIRRRLFSVYRAKICCTSFSDLFEIMTLNMCHKFVLLIHLRHAVTLTFEPFTLNVCILSVVTWSNPVPNFSEIEQCAAELLRFKYVQFVHLGFRWKWIFTVSRHPRTMMHKHIKFQHNRAIRS